MELITADGLLRGRHFVSENGQSHTKDGSQIPIFNMNRYLNLLQTLQERNLLI